jgi:hypothetical protein
MEAMRRVPGGERVRPEDCHTWEMLAELCDRSLGEILIDAMQFELAVQIGLYPGALEELALLDRGGVEIHILTARDLSVGEATRDFLLHHGVPHAHLSVHPEIDKISYCRRERIETIVDDAPHLLEQASGAGLRAFGLLHLYNSHLAGLPNISLAPDWLQLGRMLRSHFQIS